MNNLIRYVGVVFSVNVKCLVKKGGTPHFVGYATLRFTFKINFVFDIMSSYVDSRETYNGKGIFAFALLSLHFSYLSFELYLFHYVYKLF